MALYRETPNCPKCGGRIKGVYSNRGYNFVGDTFQRWDYNGHVCRLGTKYFIERTDTHLWWVKGGWTNDPMSAMIFETREKGEIYLTNSFDIPPRLECTVTEHEFVGIITTDKQ